MSRWTDCASLVNVSHLGTVKWTSPFLSNRTDARTHGRTDRPITIGPHILRGPKKWFTPYLTSGKMLIGTYIVFSTIPDRKSWISFFTNSVNRVTGLWCHLTNTVTVPYFSDKHWSWCKVWSGSFVCTLIQ